MREAGLNRGQGADGHAIWWTNVPMLLDVNFRSMSRAVLMHVNGCLLA